MKTIVAFLLIVSTGLIAYGQANTLTLKADDKSPEATLSEISWIEGSWRGEAFGGITEEVWTAPLGGSMMGSFKLVADNEVQFYELETISEEEGSLILRLKHFHKNLKGWEDKDETVEFKLVKLTENRAYFEDLTFERVNANEMNVYVVVGGDEGEQDEVKFPYQRKQE